jgi:3,4-dihydroxy 2-butanone 4-phosphate synthase/GTP cyclohydrolase II
MALNKIEEIIDDMRRGKMVILMDDEDRENEGDIIVLWQRKPVALFA